MPFETQLCAYRLDIIVTPSEPLPRLTLLGVFAIVVVVEELAAAVAELIAVPGGLGPDHHHAVAHVESHCVGVRACATTANHPRRKSGKGEGRERGERRGATRAPRRRGWRAALTTVCNSSPVRKRRVCVRTLLGPNMARRGCKLRVVLLSIANLKVNQFRKRRPLRKTGGEGDFLRGRGWSSRGDGEFKSLRRRRRRPVA